MLACVHVQFNYLQLHHCNAAPACVCAVCVCVCVCALCVHVYSMCLRLYQCLCLCFSKVYCRLQPRHERQHQPGHEDPWTPQAIGRPPSSLSLSLSLSLYLALSFPLSLFHPSLAPCISPILLPSAPLQSHFTRPNEVWPHKVNLGLPVAFAVSTAHAWPLSSVDHGPAHVNSLANTYYQTRPVITMTPSLVTTHWDRVPSVHRTCYPASAWLIQFRAYAMPSFLCPRLHY